MSSKPRAASATSYQLTAWLAQQEAQGHRLKCLHEFADGAAERLATMTAEERKELLALLDVRVEVACPGCRTDPGEVRVEGVLPQALVDR